MKILNTLIRIRYFLLAILSLPLLASPSLLSDYRQEWKHSFGNKGHEIIGKWDITGFHLKAGNNIDYMKDCQNFKRLKYILLAAIHIRNTKSIPSELLKCREKGKLPLLKKMLDILALQEMTTAQKIKKLRKDKKQKELISILKLKTKNRPQVSIPFSYWEEYYQKEKITADDDRKFYDLVNKTKQEFHKRLLNIIFAIKKERDEVIESELKMVFKKLFYIGLFDTENNIILRNDENKKKKQSLEKAVLTIFEKIDDTDLKIMFFIYLDEFYPEIVSKLKMKFTLEKYNALVRNAYWGLENPQTILPSLKRRAQKSDISNYIFKLKEHRVNANNINDYVLVSYYNFLDDREMRKLVTKEISHIYFSKDENQRFLSLELLTRPSIKREMKKVNPEFLRPIFILKRQFYLDILDKNIATDFAIYNLISLGDVRTSYLWWLIL